MSKYRYVTLFWRFIVLNITLEDVEDHLLSSTFSPNSTNFKLTPNICKPHFRNSDFYVIILFNHTCEASMRWYWKYISCLSLMTVNVWYVRTLIEVHELTYYSIWSRRRLDRFRSWHHCREAAEGCWPMLHRKHGSSFFSDLSPSNS